MTVAAPLVVNGSLNTFESNGALFASGLSRHDTHGYQLNPWAPENTKDPLHMASDVVTSMGETFSDLDLVTLRANCRQGALNRLIGYFQTYGYYPPFIYLDNDRFRPNRISVQTNSRLNGALTIQQNLDIVLEWHRESLAGVSLACDDLGIDVPISSWGTVIWNRDTVSLETEDRDSTIAGIAHFDDVDVISVACYVTTNFSIDSETAEEHYTRAFETVRLAVDNAAGKPVYVTVRLVIENNITTAVPEASFRAVIEAAEAAGAAGAFIWESAATSAAVNFAPTAVSIVQSVFGTGSAAMTDSQFYTDEAVRANAHIVPVQEQGPTTYAGALRAASAIQPINVETPQSDPANGRFVFTNEEARAIHKRLSLRSRGSDGATVPFQVIGYEEGSHTNQWVPSLLLDGSATLGTNSDGTWRSPDAITISNDYTYNSSAKVVGGGTNGRHTVQFDAGSFPFIEVEVQRAGAGDDPDVLVGLRPV